jgi:hypothetical protein
MLARTPSEAEAGAADPAATPIALRPSPSKLRLGARSTHDMRMLGPLVWGARPARRPGPARMSPPIRSCRCGRVVSCCDGGGGVATYVAMEGPALAARADTRESAVSAFYLLLVIGADFRAPALIPVPWMQMLDPPQSLRFGLIRPLVNFPTLESLVI